MQYQQQMGGGAIAAAAAEARALMCRVAAWLRRTTPGE